MVLIFHGIGYGIKLSLAVISVFIFYLSAFVSYMNSFCHNAIFIDIFKVTSITDRNFINISLSICICFPIRKFCPIITACYHCLNLSGATCTFHIQKCSVCFLNKNHSATFIKVILIIFLICQYIAAVEDQWLFLFVISLSFRNNPFNRFFLWSDFQLRIIFAVILSIIILIRKFVYRTGAAPVIYFTCCLANGCIINTAPSLSKIRHFEGA